MQEWMQYLFSGLTNGSIYAVIAVGFSMLYRSTDLINFAHGEFVMLGAMGLVTWWSGLNLPLFAAVIASVVCVAGIGLLLERFAIRAVKKPEPIVLVILTVGASIFLRGVAMIAWGKDSHSVPAFTETGPLEVLGAKFLAQTGWIVVVTVVLVVILYLFYRKTLTGKAMIATAVSRRAAWLTGIPTQTMILLAFVISTGVGGVAGVIIAPVSMCSYDMGTVLGLKGFCAAMLGGIGSLWGGLVGGILLGILESLSVGFLSSAVKDGVAFVVLLFILYVRPGGIFAARDVSRF